ncbi:TPA: hypothetical protein GFY12_22255 [Escherichia coli]|nr:hypothetical protein [Escherichia coli]
MSDPKAKTRLVGGFLRISGARTRHHKHFLDHPRKSNNSLKINACSDFNVPSRPRLYVEIRMSLGA